MIHLREHLVTENVSERDQSLRRAFSAYTQAIDVTGCENIALTILLNMTYRKVTVDDLLDKKLAKTTVNNEELINKCIDELHWFHTHNLKYPDIRVSKQNLAVDSPVLHPYVLSSANYDRAFGWAHDSAKVNLVKLFLSYFIWQGKELCLAEILSSSAKAKEWKSAFQSIGMPVKLFINVCGRVKGFLPQVTIPNTVDRYSTQVRLPYHNGYVAITPVVSHVVQSKIQQAAINKKGRFSKVGFTRSASVSQLVASLGGVVNTFDYPPYIYKKKYDLSHSLLLQVQKGKPVFNLHVLVKNQFVRALNGLIFSGGALTLKQRRQQKLISNKEIRSTLTEWLSPILEWRLETLDHNNNSTQLDNISDTLEFQLLTVSDNELSKLIMPVFALFNTMLSNLPLTQKYAFHPKLMTPFKAGVKWLLSSIPNENSTSIDDKKDQCRYLYLKDIRGFDAQALSNPYCAGIPSLTAVWGMVHRYQRNLNEALGTRIRFTSFSWFIKDYSAVAGKKLPEVSLQGVKQNELRRPGIVDNKHCDLVFDLVVHIDGFEEDLSLLDEQPEILKAHFPATFAGGVMLQPELGLTIDWCRLYSDENLLFDKLRRLPLSGRWIMPTKHKVSDLEALLFLLADNSELSPTMFGYMLLEQPEVRDGSIDILHCYAEPAIGLVEYTTAINIRIKGKESYFNNAFWMLDAQERFMLMKKV